MSVSWCLVPDAQVATASRFMAEDSMDSEDISVMSGGSSMSDTGRLRKANCDVLSSFGDLFVDVVCRDAVSGHDVRKMLALSLLVRFKNIATLISEPELLS